MALTIPGAGAAYAAAVQGISGGIPIPVTGQFGPINILEQIALTTSTSLYLSGYVVGGLQTLSNALRSPALTGKLNSIQLGIKSSQSGGFSVYLFNANPSSSTLNDHAAPVIAAADVPKIIAGPIVLPNAASGLGSNGSFSQLSSIGSTLQAVTTTLYAVLITTGLITFLTAGDAQITYGIAQD